MSEKKEVPDVPERSTQAETKPTKVPLSLFITNPDRYCLREGDELEEKKLEPLLDSLVSEGLQVPVEFYLDEQRRPVLLKGHRRVSALRILANRNTAGFVLDMRIDALEVIGGTPQDYLLRAILDNINRQTYSSTERMRAAKMLYDNGVGSKRAAFALGLSTKQFERDLLIARHGWMYDHVVENHITASDAAKLLAAAESEKRHKELKEQLNGWVADKIRQIKHDQQIRKNVTGKDLKPAEKEVKRFFTPGLVDHWIDLLKEGTPFDENAEFNFPAGVQAKTGILHLDALDLDLTNARLEDVAKVQAKLAKISKDILPFLETRSLMDSADGPQARLKNDEGPYDVEMLTKAGLSHLVAPLAAEMDAVKTQDADAAKAESNDESVGEQ